ncbi:MAG: four helix bundle protein [Polyangiaceae bacterium]
MLRIYDVVIDTVAGLRPVMERVAQHDADLARQMRRALASVPLNVAEGSSSRGRNRGARYHTAAGSMREVGAALDVAVALGYIDGVDERLRDRVGLIANTLLKNARS